MSGTSMKFGSTVSIEYMAQLCHCHHQKTHLSPAAERKLVRMIKSQPKKKKKASLQWIRSCWKTGVSVHRKNLLEENSVVTWNQTELFGHNEQQYVLRREGEAFNPENTRPTVQHGAASITLWGCFAASGSAALKKVNGIMKEEDYFQQDCARKKTHLLHRLCQEEWLKIVPEVYQKLVDGYKKRLTEQKMAKRHLTKY